MSEANEELNLANLGATKKSNSTGESKSMKKILVVVGLVLVLSAGAAAAYFLLPLGDSQATAVADADGSLAADQESEPEEDRDALYLPLHPAFVITFERPDGLRYLQVDLQVMSYDQKALDKVIANDPAVRNKLIMLFSTQDFEQLATIEGKEALREQALLAIHEVTPGTSEIDEVFFTGFVMQ